MAFFSDPASNVWVRDAGTRFLTGRGDLAIGDFAWNWYGYPEEMTRAPAFAGSGETVVFPAGKAHRFWNAGEGDLHCAAYIEPAGNAEYFLAALFASQRANGGQRPSLLDVAFLTRRYRSEYAMAAVPAVVQRLVFPVLVAVGRVLGRYAKYADAPEPMER